MSSANLAEIAYNAYAGSTGGKTWDGRDMPDWGDLGEKVQTAWATATNAACDAFMRTAWTKAAAHFAPAGSSVTVKHASPHCACGTNDAGDRYIDPICR